MCPKMPLGSIPDARSTLSLGIRRTTLFYWQTSAFMERSKFPAIVKRGHALAKIYKTFPNRCDQFTVVCYLGANRKRKTLSDLDLAVSAAEIIANKPST